MAGSAVEDVRVALERGDLVSAFDTAAGAIAAGDGSSAVRHLQTLAVARMGDTARALELFEDYRLEDSPDPHERALGARLLKDLALSASPGSEREAALARAFDAYETIYRETGDSFPGVNAATLALLAGRGGRARKIASALLAAAPRDGDYYDAAIRAEALLVLGRLDDVAAALGVEAILGSDDYGARSTTLRQLRLIADHLGLSPGARSALLAPLRPPRVVHFAGHMFAADAAGEAGLRRRIDALLAEEEAGFAYGSLACGGDLLVAEAVLERGGELHVVLPFDEQDFLAQSVRPGGADWERRYHACIRNAARILQASSMEYCGDPAQYGHASRIAMGLARLRAIHLGTEAIQLAVWDGAPVSGPAGTGADVAAWRHHGGRTRQIDPGPVNRQLVRPEPAAGGTYERRLAAILFTDFVGFSKLREKALPRFWEGVMRNVARILDRHGDAVECRNSWGDALYAVTTEAPQAAEIALELQQALAEFDYRTLGLEGGGGMRIGAHFGPVYRTIDHITGRTTFYGTEVSRAARIEPVTPPGTVFVTEPFAAILALECPDGFACRYVGRISLAKDYGTFPMYRLTACPVSA